MHGKR
jgi:hypothetical protein